MLWGVGLFALGLMACSSPTQEAPAVTKGIDTVVTTKPPTVSIRSKGLQELKQHHFPFGEDSTVATFPATPFAYAVVYALDPDKSRDGARSVFGGRTGPFKMLSVAEANRFNTIINAPTTYGGGQAGCFDPRVGLVYYNQDSLPVAHISICFECMGSNPYPSIQAQQTKVAKGLSETGSVQLKYLLAEWGFPNTRFSPMMNGKPTLDYLEDILPQVMSDSQAQERLAQYRESWEAHQLD